MNTEEAATMAMWRERFASVLNTHNNGLYEGFQMGWSSGFKDGLHTSKVLADRAAIKEEVMTSNHLMTSARHLLECLKNSQDLNMQESALVVAALIEELQERDRSFEIRWNCAQRMIKRWQEAHPGNDLVWPDQADLMMWMAEQLLLAKTAVAFADLALSVKERTTEGVDSACPCNFCEYVRARAQFKL